MLRVIPVPQNSRERKRETTLYNTYLSTQSTKANRRQTNSVSNHYTQSRKDNQPTTLFHTATLNQARTTNQELYFTPVHSVTQGQPANNSVPHRYTQSSKDNRWRLNQQLLYAGLCDVNKETGVPEGDKKRVLIKTLAITSFFVQANGCRCLVTSQKTAVTS